MASRRTGDQRPPVVVVGLLAVLVLVLLVRALGPGVLPMLGIVAVFFWLRSRSATAPTDPGSVGPERPGATTDLPPDVVPELGRLAAELAVPGGRSHEEVAREMAAVYTSLPPHVREQLEARAPRGLSRSEVTVEGPLGDVLARLLGADDVPAPAGDAPPAAVPPYPPAPAPPATPTPVVATEPGPAAPADTAVRYSVLAPDVLTGAETTTPGSVVEGWYITADRTRERWHNGSSWTAHERPRGSG